MALKEARWSIVKRRARELTKNYSSPPIPVFEIAEQFGVDVIFTDFGSNSDVVAGFCDFKEKQIVVNDDLKFGRKMFTIAHELGHWILHKEFFESDPESYTVFPRFQNPKKNPFEQEANCFAAQLLVPVHLLTPVKTAGVSRLADIFCVSREMMEFRLKNA